MDRREESGHRGPTGASEGISYTVHQRWSGPVQEPEREGTGPAFRDLRTGETIRGLTREDKFPADRDFDPSDELAQVRVGDLLQGAITGHYPNDAARHVANTSQSAAVGADFRTMAIGTDSLGGYSVPAPLAARFIDLARNKARVLEAGATTVPMTSSTLGLARLAGDATAAWKSENAQLSASDLTLEKVTLTAQTLGAYVKLSQELWQDSVNIGDMVERSLAESLALELDRVALVGSGVAPQPQGVYGATNVQTYTQNGTLTYDAVSQAVQLIRVANHEPNAMIAHPRDYGILDRLADTTNQPLQPPESYRGLTHLPSAQIPLTLGGSPDIGSSAFVGDWREMLIGMRRELGIVVSTVATDGTESAFDRYQVWVAAWLRADVQLGRPAAFCTIDELFAS